ncbi:hypothetical protein [Chitiniphilus eburneus]|nr:hypothetical protein [Chitiniphilus eburneus]
MFQADLAALLAVSIHAFQDWEKGWRNPACVAQTLGHIVLNPLNAAPTTPGPFQMGFD